MKIASIICTVLVTNFSLFAQNLTVNINVQNLVSKDGLYISESGRLIEIPSDGILNLSVENLPTLLELNTISKKGKIVTRKSIWLEAAKVLIEGSLLTDNFIISPSSKEQDLADKVLKNIKNIDQYPELLTSKPYLVYLTTTLKSKDVNYLQKIVNLVPKDDRNFWAVIKIDESLKEIQSIGYNSSTKQFEFLVAQNKAKEYQEFKQDRNKLLILDFSATWCHYCLEDIVDLRKINDGYNQKLEILSLWDDQSYTTWINGASKQKEKINWISLRDDTGVIFKKFNIKVYPTYMVIDTSGYVIKSFSNIKKLEKYISNQF
jgi:thiol-disulfide isomerase/thioredoxin